MEAVPLVNCSVQGKPRDESFEMALTEPLGTGEAVGAKGEGAERNNFWAG